MQIVIDIPERIHYGIEKGITVNGSEASQILIDAVKNGTSLSKGHGRLIDADKIDYLYGAFLDNNGEVLPLRYKIASIDMIKYCCPTIIEADREAE